MTDAKKFHPIITNPCFFWCPEVYEAADITPEMLFEKGLSVQDKVKINQYIIEKYELPYKVCKHCAIVVKKDLEKNLCTVVKGSCSFF